MLHLYEYSFILIHHFAATHFTSNFTPTIPVRQTFDVSLIHTIMGWSLQNFYTCHDSFSVVTYAKFYRDLTAKNWIKTKHYIQHISVVRQIASVRRSLYQGLQLLYSRHIHHTGSILIMSAWKTTLLILPLVVEHLICIKSKLPFEY